MKDLTRASPNHLRVYVNRAVGSFTHYLNVLGKNSSQH